MFKISHLFSGRKIKTFLEINFLIFPFLWSLTFFFSLIESFTYSGFLFKHLFLPFQLFLVLSLFSGFLARITSEKKIIKKVGNYYRILSVVNQLSFLPLLILTGIIVSIELTNYPNYVFSLYHVQPELLFWPCFLGGFLVFLDFGQLEQRWFLERLLMGKESSSRSPKFFLKRVLVFSLAAYLLTSNIYGVSKRMVKNLFIMVKAPLASYDEKMYQQWGDFYNYMIFIRENTPEDAIIMHPPNKNPWLTVGNNGLIRYFLYPRELFQSHDEKEAIDERANYAMIAWGSWLCTTGNCRGWPKVEVPAEWIIYKKKDSTEVEARFENVVYNPSDDINNGAWGLIKIKKE